MSSQGIDYGMGLSNVDLETGIRYGVISMHVVSNFWSEECESQYPDCENDECQDGICECYVEAHAYTLKTADGYAAHQTADTNDIFIFKSPYVTFARFCSPCCPGACSLESPLFRDVDDAVDRGDMRRVWASAYCFGLDCFDEPEDCPYDIYDVKTGKRVHKVKREEHT